MALRERSGAHDIYLPGPAPRPRRPASPYGFLLALLGLAVLGLWVAAQYVAYHFGFHPHLGPPWLVLPPATASAGRAGALLLTGGSVALFFLATALPRLRSLRRWLPACLLLAAFLAGLSLCRGEGRSTPVLIYPPVRFLGWGLAYGAFEEDSPYAELFTRGLLAGGGTLLFGTVVLLLVRRGPRPLVNTGSHGTAAWSDGAELIKSGAGEGVLIGRRLPGRPSPRLRRRKKTLLRYAGEGHLITVAPTRSGKGTGGIIPNLLTYEGSVLVTDPKGENYAVTARHRSRALGSVVRALDPFGQLRTLERQLEQTGTSNAGLEVVRATYNPMDLIDPYAEDWLESANLLADMLVATPAGKAGEEVFWNEEARALLTGLILYVAATELGPELRPTQNRTLARVRELLTLPKEEFKALLQEMKVSPLCSGLVRRSAARHLQKEERERSGVVSTAQSHTHFLDSARIADVTARSSIRLSRLKQDPMTLYLVLPAEYLETYHRWLRLVVACALHELARVPGKPRRRVLFLLDEFAHLGRMNPVLRAVSLMAGYGVQIWTLWQDLSQLKGTYPERWGTFLANADVLQAFGTNDHDTARYLSDLTGEATVFVETAGESLTRNRGRHATRSQGASQSYGEKGRRLLFPDEVRRMAPEEQLLFVKGLRPVRARKLNYLVDAEFRAGGKPGGQPLYDPNPLHRAGGAAERLAGEAAARPGGWSDAPGPNGTLDDSGEKHTVGSLSAPAVAADDAGEGASQQGFDDPELPPWLRET